MGGRETGGRREGQLVLLSDDPNALGPDSHRFPPKMRLRMNMKLMLFPKKVKVHVKVHTKTLMVLYPDSSWGSSFAQTQFGNLTDLHVDHTSQPVGNLEIDFDHPLPIQLCKIQSDPKNSSGVFV